MRAAPDGYTLLKIGSAVAINAALYDKLNFNFIRDIAPVAGVIRMPNVMEVTPSFPVRTVPEFIAYAKANSGKLNMASTTATRSEALPDLPTVADFVPGYEVSEWSALAHPGTHGSRSWTSLTRKSTRASPIPN